MFTMTVKVDCRKDGKEFFANDLTYSNLSYEDVVMLESKLIALAEELNKFTQHKTK